MKPIDIRYYPLPTGEFVISYYDSLRKIRTSQTFKEETKATEMYNSLRMWKSPKEEKRNLVSCTIEELLEIYFEEVPEASLRKSTQLITDFLTQFAFHKADQIDEMAMRSFYQRQKLEYDYTSHSLATRKYQIQGFFKWMVSRGILGNSPQAAISMGRSKVYRRPLIWVKPAKIQELLENAKSRSPGFLYPILLLIHETAIKTTEIIELKWTDLDFKKKMVYLPGREKIQRRHLEISDELCNSLKQIDQICQNVFTNLEGRPLRKEVLVRELRILKRQSSIDGDWVFRDLRFSYGVNFLKAGGDIIDLKKIMGHLHVRMTEELFGRFKVQRAEILALEGVVPGTGK
jgi:site-specific recombinase XerD